MRVTPLDIRRKEFKRSMRGYADEEVDIFLDEVADEFERLFQENMEMHDRMQRLEEQIAGHQQIKEALEKTLVSAQLQADEMKINAHKEGELILRDAELKARHIVNESYGETQRVQQALIQLKHLEEDFRFKFRSLLEGHLKLLNEAPITVAGAETAVLDGQVSAEAEMPLVIAEPQQMASEPVPLSISPSEVSLPHRLDDDIPTEETVDAETTLAEEPTAESVMKPEEVPLEPAEKLSVRGFVFGRRLEEDDDSFLDSDAVKTEKGRDFEW